MKEREMKLCEWEYSTDFSVEQELTISIMG